MCMNDDKTPIVLKQAHAFVDIDDTMIRTGLCTVIVSRCVQNVGVVNDIHQYMTTRVHSTSVTKSYLLFFYPNQKGTCKTYKVSSYVD